VSLDEVEAGEEKVAEPAVDDIAERGGPPTAAGEAA
jgi:hypothetical protein